MSRHLSCKPTETIDRSVWSSSPQISGSSHSTLCHSCTGRWGYIFRSLWTTTRPGSAWHNDPKTSRCHDRTYWTQRICDTVATRLFTTTTTATSTSGNLEYVTIWHEVRLFSKVVVGVAYCVYPLFAVIDGIDTVNNRLSAVAEHVSIMSCSGLLHALQELPSRNLLGKSYEDFLS